MADTLSIQTLSDGRVALISNGERGEVIGIRTCDFERFALAITGPASNIASDEHLTGLVEELLDNVYVPERNCSCHISPPCNDCVENSGLREIVAAVCRALDARKKTWLLACGSGRRI